MQVHHGQLLVPVVQFDYLRQHVILAVLTKVLLKPNATNQAIMAQFNGIVYFAKQLG